MRMFAAQWPNADGSCSHCSATGFRAFQPLPRSPALHYCGLTWGRVSKKPSGNKCQNALLYLAMHSDHLLPRAHPLQDLDGRISRSEAVSPFSSTQRFLSAAVIITEGRNGDGPWITGSGRLVRPLCWLPGVRAGSRGEGCVRRPSPALHYRDRVLGSG